MNARIRDTNAEHAYYTLQASGPRGRELADILARRHTRVVVTRRVTGGLTLNFLNTIFLQPLRAEANDAEYKGWVCLLAHEACHIEQKFWIDSIQQEMRAYASQARVAQELGIDLGVIQRVFGNLNPDRAADQNIARAELSRLFGQTPAGIVYASLPLGQPVGLYALVPALRQITALVRAAFYRPMA